MNTNDLVAWQILEKLGGPENIDDIIFLDYKYSRYYYQVNLQSEQDSTVLSLDVTQVEGLLRLLAYSPEDFGKLLEIV